MVKSFTRKTSNIRLMINGFWANICLLVLLARPILEDDDKLVASNKMLSIFKLVIPDFWVLSFSTLLNLLILCHLKHMVVLF